MPICLDICLMSERYDCGDGEDPRSPEWPPHPARVIAALRSVAEPDELSPLYELEQLPPPLIYAASTTTHAKSRAFVVTNARENKGKHQNHPARTSGLRERISSFPADPRVQFIWPAELSDETLTGLDVLARRVPYLGRSTSTAILGFRRVTDIKPLAGLSTFEPTSPDRAEFTMRTSYPGFLDELNALFELNQPAWQANRGQPRQPYRLLDNRIENQSLSTFDSPYPDLVILRFVDKRPAGNLVGLFTSALRAKVMSQTENPLPPVLHGHGFNGKPHVAYLGLPFAGFDHADGHLVALAVAIPGLERSERRRILRGILGPDPDRLVQLQVPGFRKPFMLRYSPDDPRPFSATTKRWMRGSQDWVSVTPLILDSYPKRDDFAGAVIRSIRQAGYPEPRSVEMSTHPLTPGAVRLTPNELPKRAQRRLYRHVRISFEQSVRGPVLVGAGRYFGVGLFAPESKGGQ